MARRAPREARAALESTPAADAARTRTGATRRCAASTSTPSRPSREPTRRCAPPTVLGDLETAGRARAARPGRRPRPPRRRGARRGRRALVAGRRRGGARRSSSTATSAACSTCATASSPRTRRPGAAARSCTCPAGVTRRACRCASSSRTPRRGARTLWRTLVVVEAGARLTLHRGARARRARLPQRRARARARRRRRGRPRADAGAAPRHVPLHRRTRRDRPRRDAALVLARPRRQARQGAPGVAPQRARLDACARRASTRSASASTSTSTPRRSTPRRTPRQRPRLQGRAARPRALGLARDHQGRQGRAGHGRVPGEPQPAALAATRTPTRSPASQILANDVRCTHAATVSRVDSELLFFLMARGFARREAEQMLVHGVLRRRARADREPRACASASPPRWRCAQADRRSRNREVA